MQKTEKRDNFERIKVYLKNHVRLGFNLFRKEFYNFNKYSFESNFVFIKFLLLKERDLRFETQISKDFEFYKIKIQKKISTYLLLNFFNLLNVLDYMVNYFFLERRSFLPLYTLILPHRYVSFNYFIKSFLKFLNSYIFIFSYSIKYNFGLIILKQQSLSNILRNFFFYIDYKIIC